MSQAVIAVDRVGPARARRMTDRAIQEGGDLVLDFGEDADPKRVFKYLEWLGAEHRVEITIRHAELEEFVTGIVAGAAIGAAAAAVAALAAGGPVAWTAIATAAGIGAIVGLALTPVTVRVYRYRGHTRVRISA